MENNVQEDYKSEILGIVRSNASPGSCVINWKIIMRTIWQRCFRS